MIYNPYENHYVRTIQIGQIIILIFKFPFVSEEIPPTVIFWYQFIRNAW